MSADILKKVSRYLAEAVDGEVNVDSVSRDTSLREDFELDSLQSITMVMDLEDHYDIQIEEDEISSLARVGDIVDLIAKKKQQSLLEG